MSSVALSLTAETAGLCWHSSAGGTEVNYGGRSREEVTQTCWAQTQAIEETGGSSALQWSWSWSEWSVTDDAIRRECSWDCVLL